MWPGGSPYRLGLMFALIFVVMAAATIRLGYLQLRLGGAYAEEARGNALRETFEAPPRGYVLDRLGRVLAGNRSVLTLSLRVDAGALTADRLAELARVSGLSESYLTRRIRHYSGQLYSPVLLITGVDAAVFTALAERASEYPEFVLGWAPAREYPLGPVAAHLIGYIGEVSAMDLLRHPDRYRAGDLRGLTGVEAACDWLLRGTPARFVYQVDAFGRSVDLPRTETGEIGLDVRLTVDAALQQAAHDSLSLALRKVKSRSEGLAGAAGSMAEAAGGRAEAAGGAVVALDPRSGAVLAMVSLPSWDPEQLSGPGAGEAIPDLADCPGTPFLNRATEGLYATGSTFKVVTALAALEAGVTTTDEFYLDSGAHRLVPKKCWKRDGHGAVSLVPALAVSCNVYFYEMGLRLGVERLAAAARLFGLGEPSGFDLYRARGAMGPGLTGPETGVEPCGVVPDTAYKARSFPNDPVFWPAEVMDAAIGEGLHAYTPLQMAVLTAALANGGTRWRPYVIEAVLGPGGEILARAQPEIAGLAEFSPAGFQTVREGMRQAAMSRASPAGTAASVFGPSFKAAWGVEVGGKTGTHERGSGTDRADDGWFIGFIPYDNPQLVVVVVVEEGVSGARSAAPVARAVMEAWLKSVYASAGP